MLRHFPNFLQLPKELRFLVYEYVLAPEHPPQSIQWKAEPGETAYGGESKTGISLALLLTNKRIHSEASVILFQERFLTFDIFGLLAVRYDDELRHRFSKDDPFRALSERLNQLRQDSFLPKVRNVKITLRHMTEDSLIPNERLDDARYSHLAQQLTLICHTLNSQGCRLDHVLIEVACKCPLCCAIKQPRNTAYSKAMWNEAQKMTINNTNWTRLLSQWEAQERCFSYSAFVNLIKHLDILRVSSSVDMITSCTKPTATELYPEFNKLTAIMKSNSPVRELTGSEKAYFKELRAFYSITPRGRLMYW